MKSNVLPDLILFSLSLGLGLYEILGWSVRRPTRQNLLLAMLFITSSIYAAGCAGQYDAASVEATVPWLRLQSGMLCFSAIGLIQFFAAVTGLIPRHAKIGITVAFGVFALSQFLDLGALTWNGAAGRMLQVRLPFGLGWNFYEAATGPITDIQTIVSIVFFPFLFFVARRFKRMDPIKGKRLLAIPVVITIAWANDLAVSYGLFSTPYVMEYAFIVGAVYAGLDRAERERDADMRIRASLAEKEILIRELYHRTKNNMQVVYSLLKLHSKELESESARAVFKDVANKIVAMSLVHQKLYESQDLSNIRIKDYIEELVSLLLNSYGTSKDRIEVVPDIEDCAMLIDTAVPLGLVISEITANSLKYAFPDERRGKIGIELKNAGDFMELRMADDGIGVPESFQVAANGRMGMRTLYNLVEHQLQGSIQFSSKGGVAYLIRFRGNPHGERVRLDGKA